MGGKKSKPTIGYWYKLAIHFLMGKAIDVLLEIRGGDKTAWSGFQSTSGTIAIAAKNLWGGEKAEGGIEGDFELMMGEPDQMPNAYLGAVFGAKNPGFRGKATGVFKGGLYGAFNPYPKAMSFKVRRILTDWEGGSAWLPEYAPIPIGEEAYVPVEYPEGTAVELSWHQSTAEQGVNDQAGMGIAYFDASGTQIGSTEWSTIIDTPTSGTQPAFPFLWTGRTLSSTTPAGATKVRVFQKMVRRTGVENNGNIDSIELSIGGSAVALVNPGAETGTATGWTGDVGVRNLYGAHAGTYYFWGGSGNAEAIAYQDVQNLAYSGLLAMNPAHMLYESTISQFGLGEQATIIDDESLTAAAIQLHSEGFGLCMKFDPRHQTVEQFQRRIEQIIDGRFTQSRVDGKYRLILIRDNYVLDDLPILTDDDILEFREEDSDPLESVNQVMIEWFDPQQKEKRITPPINALAAIRASGGILSETSAFPEIPYEGLALRVGGRDLGYKSRPAKRFSLTTNRTPYSWLGGQLFRLQAPRRGIADMVCLLGELGAGVPRSGSMRIKASQHISALRSAVYVTGEPGVDHTPTPTPVATALQRLVEAPYLEMADRLSASDLGALSDDAGFALAMASRPEGGVDYSLYTGAGSEDLVDRGFADYCPTALVVESADRIQAGPFTLSSPSDLAEVVVGSLALWGDELVRVDAIDAEALTIELGRGCGDTVGQLHSANERIWFIDDGAGSDGREYSDGEVVHAKLLTRTSSAELALADATEVTATMNSRAARPYPPAKLLIDGLAPGAAVSETFSLSWSNRDRLLQADQLVDQEAASIGPEANTSYTVRVINDASNAVVLELESLGGDAVDILLAADYAALRVEMFAVRNGLTSWQTQVTDAFAYTAGAEGADYGTDNPGSPGTGTGTPATISPDDSWAQAGGTANAITATFDTTLTLGDGLELRVRASAANSGATTFDPNGLGPIAVTKLGGVALAAGDIAAAGHELILRYVASVPRWELLNPAASGGGGSGDVVGPASSIDGRLALYDGVTGKLLKQGSAPPTGTNTGDQVASGVPITDAGGFFSSGNVEGALQEVAALSGLSPFALPQLFTRALGRGNAGYWSQAAGTTTNTGFGFNIAGSPATTGTFSAGAISATNAITQSARDVMTSAAGAGSQCWRGISSALACVRGGFLFGMRGAVIDAATVANSRMFMGLRALQTAPGNVEPDTLVNCILLGSKAGDANLSVFWNDASGACSQTPLGSGFPAQTLSADIYTFEIYCAPGATTAYYGVTRYELATGTLTVSTGPMAGNLPASTTLMSPQWWRNNGATALAVSMANMNVYGAWNLEG